ncbi:acetyl-CoA hydrolase/transferase family protein [Cupriavidus sp. Marseille-Q8015]
MYRDRIRLASLHSKVVSADEAARLIHDGMTVGMSGFTRAGGCKAVPFALARRAADDPLQITLITGASLGNDVDKVLTESHVLARRLPFQSDATLRAGINNGEIAFIDQHLGEVAEWLRDGHLAPVDVAVIEATAITESGGIVPTTSVGNSASFALQASKVIVEINLNMPAGLEGLHDVSLPVDRPYRQPIPLIAPEQRIGLPYIPVDPARIAAIVITQDDDSPSNAAPADDETQRIASHLIALLVSEVKAGRLPPSLRPLQAGIGTIANAVLQGLADAPFHDLTMYSEVLQDSTIALIDAGKLRFASASSMTLSRPVYDKVLRDIERYKSHLVLRPQEISNHAEVLRRLGPIAINTALECDIYGNVNSTHVGGTHMMNGIGGSGDFARNAYLSVFVTKSVAKGGKVSSIVPMVPHVDNAAHDVDILVTEHGLADLRGLAPRERARAIIANCVDPGYRDALQDYFTRACARGGQTPHLLEEAFAMHMRYRDTGTMLRPTVVPSAVPSPVQSVPGIAASPALNEPLAA